MSKKYMEECVDMLASQMLAVWEVSTAAAQNPVVCSSLSLEFPTSGTGLDCRWECKRGF